MRKLEELYRIDMQGLKDIKYLMNIQDYSWVFALVFFLSALVFFFYIMKKVFFKKHVKTPIEIAKEKLGEISFADSKQTAYILSEILPILDEEKEFEKFLTVLDKYKYKKKVDAFSEEDENTILQIKEKYGI
jgi:hypothetical protein